MHVSSYFSKKETTMAKSRRSQSMHRETIKTSGMIHDTIMVRLCGHNFPLCADLFLTLRELNLLEGFRNHFESSCVPDYRIGSSKRISQSLRVELSSGLQNRESRLSFRFRYTKSALESNIISHWTTVATWRRLIRSPTYILRSVPSDRPDGPVGSMDRIFVRWQTPHGRWSLPNFDAWRS